MVSLRRNLLSWVTATAIATSHYWALCYSQYTTTTLFVAPNPTRAVCESTSYEYKTASGSTFYYEVDIYPGQEDSSGQCDTSGAVIPGEGELRVENSQYFLSVSPDEFWSITGRVESCGAISVGANSEVASVPRTVMSCQQTWFGTYTSTRTISTSYEVTFGNVLTETHSISETTETTTLSDRFTWTAALAAQTTISDFVFPEYNVSDILSCSDLLESNGNVASSEYFDCLRSAGLPVPDTASYSECIDTLPDYDAYYKCLIAPTTPSSEPNDSLPLGSTTIVVIVVPIFIAMAAGAGLCMYWRRMRQRRKIHGVGMRDHQEAEPTELKASVQPPLPVNMENQWRLSAQGVVLSPRPAPPRQLAAVSIPSHDPAFNLPTNQQATALISAPGIRPAFAQGSLNPITSPNTQPESRAPSPSSYVLPVEAPASPTPLLSELRHAQSNALVEGTNESSPGIPLQPWQMSTATLKSLKSGFPPTAASDLVDSTSIRQNSPAQAMPSTPSQPQDLARLQARIAQLENQLQPPPYQHASGSDP